MDYLFLRDLLFYRLENNVRYHAGEKGDKHVKVVHRVDYFINVIFINKGRHTRHTYDISDGNSDPSWYDMVEFDELYDRIISDRLDKD